MKKPESKHIVGILIIAAAIAWLAWSLLTASYRFVITPGEFLSTLDAYTGEEVKLVGIVKEGTILSKGTDLKFKLADEKESVDIHYMGTVPNNFREGGEVVASGIYDRKRDILEASELLSKCASKYSPRD